MNRKIPVVTLSAFLVATSPVMAINELSGNAGTEHVFLASVQQARKTIRGTVVDNTGLPVIGANVIVKGSVGVGTVTNVDGDFILEGIEDGATLMISYIGYVDQEIAVAKGKSIIKLRSMKIHKIWMK